RTLHRVAEVGQHLRDTAHADTADSDEMDRSDVARQFHSEGAPDAMIARTRSASRSAASIAPADLAAAAIVARRCGAAASLAISEARGSGVKSPWRSRMAPPACSSTPALACWS